MWQMKVFTASLRSPCPSLEYPLPNAAPTFFAQALPTRQWPQLTFTAPAAPAPVPCALGAPLLVLCFSLGGLACASGAQNVTLDV